MRTRIYRRYTAEKIAFKRWKRDHRSRDFGHQIFPYLSQRLGTWWASPIGRYRKWNGTCGHCQRCKRMGEMRDKEHDRTEFSHLRSKIIR